MRLKNKVAIVTGASGGIGKNIAHKFAKEGANIVINYFNSEQEANKTVKSIKEIGNEAIALKADISNEEEVKRLVNKTLEKFNKIDVLINNAGISERISYQEITGNKWDELMNVNLKGYFLCSKEVGEIMKKQESGKIINISSVTGLRPRALGLHYNISKAGCIMLTKCFALALAPYVQVNSIAPGFIQAGMNQYRDETYLSRVKNETPLNRLGQPDDVAKACIFLSTEESSFITGQLIVVDGGRSLEY